MNDIKLLKTKTFKETQNNVDDFNVIPRGWGYRHQQCLILFCCITTAYSMRACMGVALVAMTTAHGNTTTFTNTTATGVSESNNVSGFLYDVMLIPPYPAFGWSKKIQDTIQSSFFWGYMMLQVPAGQLAHRFGAKYLIFATMSANAVISICLPWAALYGGWSCIAVLRFLQGLSQSCLFPSTHTFFGKWAPLQERGRLTAYVYGGQALGTVLGLPVTGFIASSGLGWPGIFRFYGVLSGIVSALWWCMGYDSPAAHPAISLTERTYIENALGQTKVNAKTQLPVPWRSILTSWGMWAIVVAHVGQTWGQLILYSEIPAFMDKVMGVNIKANGLLTALPFMVMFVANFGYSWLYDYIINAKLLSVTHTRKLANTIGCWPPALALVILAYAPKNIYTVETFLVIICTFKISAHLGFQVNHIDIAPNLAGTMMSISNFASNLISSFAPIITAFILTDVSDERLWGMVFCLAGALYFFTNLVYIIFGTAEKAAWNDPQMKENEDILEMDLILKSTVNY